MDNQDRPQSTSNADSGVGSSTPPKIRFNAPSPLGSPPPEPVTPVEPEPVGPAQVVGSSKIRTNERVRDHGERWNRKPNVTGSGATHVRTFHSKLNDESLAYLDQQINEWLDEHAEYEVKFSVSTIGMFTGKTKEPALICQVWI